MVHGDQNGLTGTLSGDADLPGFGIKTGEAFAESQNVKKPDFSVLLRREDSGFAS